MTRARERLLDELAARVLRLDPPHPVRVGIEGPDAAGKTTLADELASRLAAGGRTVVRASADAFAQPADVRHRRGREDPDGYYADSTDLSALTGRLLDPCGPGGDRRIRTRWFDVEREQRVDEAPRPIPVDAILIVDGLFLGRPELRDRWDLRVFVAVPPEVTVLRALARDVPRLGPAAQVEQRYRRRYLPAQAAYLLRDGALETADLVVDNTDPGRPTLRERGGVTSEAGSR